jgi:uncharacterized protein
VSLMQFILVLVIRSYRLLLSPVLSAIFAPLGLGCRFTPTCSQYALEAVRNYGAGCGSLLATKRLCRCHPWGGSGYDPVPPTDRHLDLDLDRAPHPDLSCNPNVPAAVSPRAQRAEKQSLMTSAATRKS